jgi:hypothetical protein
VSENKMLRKISGLMKNEVNGKSRILYKRELHNFFTSRGIAIQQTLMCRRCRQAASDSECTVFV